MKQRGLAHKFIKKQEKKTMNEKEDKRKSRLKRERQDKKTIPTSRRKRKR